MKKLLALSLTTVLTTIPLSQLTDNKAVARNIDSIEWNLNLNKKKEFNKPGITDNGKFPDSPLEFSYANFATNWNEFVYKYPYFYFKTSSFMEASIVETVKDDLKTIYKTADIASDFGIMFGVTCSNTSQTSSIYLYGSLGFMQNKIILGFIYNVTMGQTGYGYVNVYVPSLIFTSQNKR